MVDKFGVAGKVAVITGGASGIGKGAAKSFAEAGMKVVLLDRNEEGLEKAAAEIGGEVRTFLVDVSKPESLRDAMIQAAEAFGRIDVLYANAGINGVWAPLEEITEEEFDRTISINLKGTFFTIQAALPFLQRQGGSVIVTSSVNGTRTFSNTGATVYSTSKAGQVAMMKMLAIELGAYKIRVNAICPGAISTNIDKSTEQRDTDKIGVKKEFPEGGNPLEGEESGSIEQVGDVALFLASELASHVSGEVIFVDAAQSLV
ncbi:SDR family oxidoreductase [bacterium]|nr:MAG: SDR family oxidoreductase [bacterium]